MKISSLLLIAVLGANSEARPSTTEPSLENHKISHFGNGSFVLFLPGKAPHLSGYFKDSSINELSDVILEVVVPHTEHQILESFKSARAFFNAERQKSTDPSTLKKSYLNTFYPTLGNTVDSDVKEAYVMELSRNIEQTTPSTRLILPDGRNPYAIEEYQRILQRLESCTVLQSGSHS